MMDDDLLFWLTIALDSIVILALIAIAIIDARRMIIPDLLTLLIACAAAVNAFFAGQYAMTDALVGAGLAFVLFDGTRRVMTWRLRREAMGFGDVKLMAAGGLWVGAQNLSAAILAACGLALVALILRLIIRGRAMRDAPLPFGPYLACGLMIGKVWQSALISL